MDYQELIEQWRKAVTSPFNLGPVADAIESLLAENERLKAELAKYRDAHVVAWVNKRVPNYVEWNSAFTLPNSTPLIVKPDENK